MLYKIFVVRLLINSVLVIFCGIILSEVMKIWVASVMRKCPMTEGDADW